MTMRKIKPRNLTNLDTAYLILVNGERIGTITENTFHSYWMVQMDHLPTSTEFLKLSEATKAVLLKEV